MSIVAIVACWAALCFSLHLMSKKAEAYNAEHKKERPVVAPAVSFPTMPVMQGLPVNQGAQPLETSVRATPDIYANLGPMKPEE